MVIEDGDFPSNSSSPSSPSSSSSSLPSASPCTTTATPAAPSITGSGVSLPFESLDPKNFLSPTSSFITSSSSASSCDLLHHRRHPSVLSSFSTPLYQTAGYLQCLEEAPFSSSPSPSTRRVLEGTVMRMREESSLPSSSSFISSCSLPQKKKKEGSGEERDGKGGGGEEEENEKDLEDDEEEEEEEKSEADRRTSYEKMKKIFLAALDLENVRRLEDVGLLFNSDGEEAEAPEEQIRDHIYKRNIHEEKKKNDVEIKNEEDGINKTQNDKDEYIKMKDSSSLSFRLRGQPLKAKPYDITRNGKNSLGAVSPSPSGLSSLNSLSHDKKTLHDQIRREEKCLPNSHRASSSSPSPHLLHSPLLHCRDMPSASSSSASLGEDRQPAPCSPCASARHRRNREEGEEGHERENKVPPFHLSDRVKEQQKNDKREQETEMTGEEGEEEISTCQDEYEGASCSLSCCPSSSHRQEEENKKAVEDLRHHGVIDSPPHLQACSPLVLLPSSPCSSSSYTSLSLSSFSPSTCCSSSSSTASPVVLIRTREIDTSTTTTFAIPISTTLPSPGDRVHSDATQGEGEFFLSEEEARRKPRDILSSLFSSLFKECVKDLLQSSGDGPPLERKHSSDQRGARGSSSFPPWQESQVIEEEEKEAREVVVGEERKKGEREEKEEERDEEEEERAMRKTKKKGEEGKKLCEEKDRCPCVEVREKLTVEYCGRIEEEERKKLKKKKKKCSSHNKDDSDLEEPRIEDEENWERMNEKATSRRNPPTRQGVHPPYSLHIPSELIDDTRRRSRLSSREERNSASSSSCMTQTPSELPKNLFSDLFSSVFPPDCLYTPVSLLDKGTLGRVFRCLDRRHTPPVEVAVKIIQKKILKRNPKLRQQVLDEKEALRRLSTPVFLPPPSSSPAIRACSSSSSSSTRCSSSPCRSSPCGPASVVGGLQNLTRGSNEGGSSPSSSSSSCISSCFSSSSSSSASFSSSLSFMTSSSSPRGVSHAATEKKGTDCLKEGIHADSFSWSSLPLRRSGTGEVYVHQPRGTDLLGSFSSSCSLALKHISSTEMRSPSPFLVSSSDSFPSHRKPTEARLEKHDPLLSDRPLNRLHKELREGEREKRREFLHLLSCRKENLLRSEGRHDGENKPCPARVILPLPASSSSSTTLCSSSSSHRRPPVIPLPSICPFIPRLIHSFKEKDVLFLVMPLAGERNLQEILLRVSSLSKKTSPTTTTTSSLARGGGEEGWIKAGDGRVGEGSSSSYSTCCVSSLSSSSRLSPNGISPSSYSTHQRPSQNSSSSSSPCSQSRSSPSPHFHVLSGSSLPPHVSSPSASRLPSREEEKEEVASSSASSSLLLDQEPPSQHYGWSRCRGGSPCLLQSPSSSSSTSLASSSFSSCFVSPRCPPSLSHPKPAGVVSSSYIGLHEGREGMAISSSSSSSECSSTATHSSSSLSSSSSVHTTSTAPKTPLTSPTGEGRERKEAISSSSSSQPLLYHVSSCPPCLYHPHDSCKPPSEQIASSVSTVMRPVESLDGFPVTRSRYIHDTETHKPPIASSLNMSTIPERHKRDDIHRHRHSKRRSPTTTTAAHSPPPRLRLTDEAVRTWTAELVAALEWFRMNGVVHRDLKPQNLVISSTGHLTVVDFGSVLLLSRGGGGGEVGGGMMTSPMVTENIEKAKEEEEEKEGKSRRVSRVRSSSNSSHVNLPQNYLRGHMQALGGEGRVPIREKERDRRMKNEGRTGEEEEEKSKDFQLRKSCVRRVLDDRDDGRKDETRRRIEREQKDLLHERAKEEEEDMKNPLLCNNTTFRLGYQGTYLYCAPEAFFPIPSSCSSSHGHENKANPAQSTTTTSPLSSSRSLSSSSLSLSSSPLSSSSASPSVYYALDLWSLGCLTYEMLAGRPAFAAATVKETLERIRLAIVDFPSFFAPDACDFVSRLLVTDPFSRLGFYNIYELRQHPFLSKTFKGLLGKDEEGLFRENIRSLWVLPSTPLKRLYERRCRHAKKKKKKEQNSESLREGEGGGSSMKDSIHRRGRETSLDVTPSSSRQARHLLPPSYHEGEKKIEGKKGLLLINPTEDIRGEEEQEEEPGRLTGARRMSDEKKEDQQKKMDENDRQEEEGGKYEGKEENYHEVADGRQCEFTHVDSLREEDRYLKKRSRSRVGGEQEEEEEGIKDGTHDKDEDDADKDVVKREQEEKRKEEEAIDIHSSTDRSSCMILREEDDGRTRETVRGSLHRDKKKENSDGLNTQERNDESPQGEVTEVTRKISDTLLYHAQEKEKENRNEGKDHEEQEILFASRRSSGCTTAASRRPTGGASQERTPASLLLSLQEGKRERLEQKKKDRFKFTEEKKTTEQPEKDADLSPNRQNEPDSGVGGEKKSTKTEEKKKSEKEEEEEAKDGERDRNRHRGGSGTSDPLSSLIRHVKENDAVGSGNYLSPGCVCASFSSWSSQVVVLLNGEIERSSRNLPGEKRKEEGNKREEEEEEHDEDRGDEEGRRRGGYEDKEISVGVLSCNDSRKKNGEEEKDRHVGRIQREGLSRDASTRQLPSVPLLNSFASLSPSDKRPCDGFYGREQEEEEEEEEETRQESDSSSADRTGSDSSSFSSLVPLLPFTEGKKRKKVIPRKKKKTKRHSNTRRSLLGMIPSSSSSSSSCCSCSSSSSSDGDSEGETSSASSSSLEVTPAIQSKPNPFPASLINRHEEDQSHNELENEEEEEEKRRISRSFLPPPLYPVEAKIEEVVGDNRHVTLSLPQSPSCSTNEQVSV
ncbi:protein kinase domain-containing protein [Cystoisospora suis]|uniref:Protein kinase domain-containing protein n=1 Tax=Cystoisospora suis TaxID=483139 RepID=A0A2C6L158_9APIC|nr:protein kinase domain-containing protein [Cystoisospora suis]